VRCDRILRSCVAGEGSTILLPWTVDSWCGDRGKLEIWKQAMAE